MTTTTAQLQYDHATYLTRQIPCVGANAANTNHAAFSAALAAVAYSATFTIITAGTSSGAVWVINQISGTTTTALATATLSTTAAAGVLNVALSTKTGGVALAQGDRLVGTKGADTATVSSLSYELVVAPAASVTN